ncbi:MAG: DegT/DnrJ/EryC1/StrS family aminotransferase [Candidatus Bathyarchaeota archaeon]|uniref:DegT/DnrJ/EryC1/StrS family aminotransferase n=2 Tax=Candidatus Bathycorpusculum sp. TaxID=2994959 RepID=UPI002837958D|nr:DegT/DnrJ/EryC1/StrS family aminotransferase [Candidatus Termiticorpusculum sp.]
MEKIERSMVEKRLFDKMKNIPFIKPSVPPIDEYFNEISDIWHTTMFTNIHSKHEKLEDALKKHLAVNNVSLFVNGHMALEAALSYFQLKGEVITSPFTFSSTCLAIMRNGLTPVFCDINEKNYTVNVDSLERLINEKTCAVLPVHIYGNVCDVYAIEKISEKYEVPVIYDAAHAFGVKVNERGIGSFGNISMFSFHSTKVFNTVEGGALTYADDKMYEHFAHFRNFGQKNRETVIVGANMKMSELHAAMGLCNLRHINSCIEKRKNCVNRYNERLIDIKGLHLNQPQNGVVSNYTHYPIRINEKEFGETRDSVFERLSRHDITTQKYYYPLVSNMAIFDKNPSNYDTPVADEIAKQILVLPLYSELTIEDVDYVCKIILEHQ